MRGVWQRESPTPGMCHLSPRSHPGRAPPYSSNCATTWSTCSTTTWSTCHSRWRCIWAAAVPDEPLVTHSDCHHARSYHLRGRRTRDSQKKGVYVTCTDHFIWRQWSRDPHSTYSYQVIQLEFSPTWSCVSLTRSTTLSEWKLFRFDKMEVNDFEMLLIYLSHVKKLVFNVLIKNWENNSWWVFTDSMAIKLLPCQFQLYEVTACCCTNVNV